MNSIINILANNLIHSYFDVLNFFLSLTIMKYHNILIPFDPHSLPNIVGPHSQSTSTIGSKLNSHAPFGHLFGDDRPC